MYKSFEKFLKDINAKAKDLANKCDATTKAIEDVDTEIESIIEKKEKALAENNDSRYIELHTAQTQLKAKKEALTEFINNNGYSIDSEFIIALWKDASADYNSYIQPKIDEYNKLKEKLYKLAYEIRTEEKELFTAKTIGFNHIEDIAERNEAIRLSGNTKALFEFGGLEKANSFFYEFSVGNKTQLL